MSTVVDRKDQIWRR